MFPGLFSYLLSPTLPKSPCERRCGDPSDVPFAPGAHGRNLFSRASLRAACRQHGQTPSRPPPGPALSKTALAASCRWGTDSRDAVARPGPTDCQCWTLAKTALVLDPSISFLEPSVPFSCPPPNVTGNPSKWVPSHLSIKIEWRLAEPSRKGVPMLLRPVSLWAGARGDG